ncbi:RNA polymerase sigma factor [Winogradskyella flava]|uniref:RNA polymerase sigma factor n=1 Tax=Winogradskyella flava TaxID=1884876 RepID=UPI0024919C29|nr:RNA polymerase sigma factor [Winogradskyella flava]
MDSHYLQKVLNGDTDAFNYFVKKYQNRGFAIAMSVVKNKDDAKDVLQESFLKAYNTIDTFREDSKFSTWFYRILINKALQLITKNKRRLEIIADYQISQNEISEYNNALKNMDNEFLKKTIKIALKKLPYKQALVLQLYYIDDYKIDEIQEMTALAKANIKVLMHRGRLNFYNNMKTKDFYNG